ncbi:hypothetical protein Agabi119p4_3754 [Agaricus bisporus var. burnettii]|uniref:Uncharacterized protein n=1 Tax=Agaricus bisporus var. burnettii TaxID=192524 RepID=A0A8H7KIF1_AGABI|nr:hypothetical protein Agabi119p4_3754 [Agaricus bisporus var. burnettii]
MMFGSPHSPHSPTSTASPSPDRAVDALLVTASRLWLCMDIGRPKSMAWACSKAALFASRSHMFASRPDVRIVGFQDSAR